MEKVRLNNHLFDITVLMGVYNGQGYISQSMESILLQTYKDFEFIIINDGSTDDTLKIISSYEDSRIRIINQNNAGLTRSLNQGISLAKGEYIARIDADDISMPERLSTQVQFLKSNPDVALVGANAILIDEDGKKTGKTDFPSKNNELINKMIELISPFPHSTACFRRETALSLGGYNERFTRGQDFDLWLRMSQKYRIACINEPLIMLRKSFESISFKGDESLSYKMGIIALIDYFRRLNGLDEFSSATNDTWKTFGLKFDQWFRKHKYEKKAKAKKHFKTFMVELAKRNLLNALKELVNSFKLDPFFFTYRGIGIKVPGDIIRWI